MDHNKLSISDDLHREFKKWCGDRGLQMKFFAELLIRREMGTLTDLANRSPRRRKVVLGLPDQSVAALVKVRPDYGNVYVKPPFWQQGSDAAEWQEERQLVMMLQDLQDTVKVMSPAHPEYATRCNQRRALEERLGLTPTKLPATTDKPYTQQRGACSLCGGKVETTDDACEACEAKAAG